MEQRIGTELNRHALTVREVLTNEASRPDLEDVQDFVTRFGSAIDARITLIREDGVVIGDSTLSMPGVQAMDNHANRPEIEEAFRSGRGEIKRYSTTTKREMFYVAVSFLRENRGFVARISISLDDVDEIVGRFRRILLVGGLAGLVLALLISAFASHLWAKTLLRQVNRARDLAFPQSSMGTDNQGAKSRADFSRSLLSLEQELGAVVSEVATERDRFRGVIDQMQVGIVALDANLVIVRSNNSANQLLGIDTSHNGMAWSQAVSHTALIEFMGGTLEQSNAYGTFEHVGSTARSVMAQRIYEPVEKGWILVIHDVTELRRLERVRQDFVANVSHELRTPVSVILANSELLLDGAIQDPEVGQEFTSAILRNAKRLSSLISDLLDLSRIEAGQASLQMELFTLTPVVEQTIERLSVTARDCGITVVQETEAGHQVFADRSSFEQVLINLVENAIKYSERGGVVTIRSEGLGDQVGVSVIDEGRGIEPHHMERIFERFYRIDTGRSREMGGTGLGLSIVKHLVAAMHGTIEVRANEPSGAIFSVVMSGVEGTKTT